MLIRYFESEKIAAGSRAGWAGPSSLGRSMALSIIMVSPGLYLPGTKTALLCQMHDWISSA